MQSPGMKESATLVAFHVSFHVSFHPNTKMIPTVVSTLRLLEEPGSNRDSQELFSYISLLPAISCLSRVTQTHLFGTLCKSGSIQVNSSQFKLLPYISLAA